MNEELSWRIFLPTNKVDNRGWQILDYTQHKAYEPTCHMWRNEASFHLEGCSENVPAQITQSVLSELDLLELLNLFFLTDFVFACFTTFAFEFFPFAR